MMDKTAPKDDLHDHPDLDIHIKRQNGELQAVVWILGTRHELREIECFT